MPPEETDDKKEYIEIDLKSTFFTNLVLWTIDRALNNRDTEITLNKLINSTSLYILAISGAVKNKIKYITKDMIKLQ